MSARERSSSECARAVFYLMCVCVVRSISVRVPVRIDLHKGPVQEMEEEHAEVPESSGTTARKCEELTSW